MLDREECGKQFWIEILHLIDENSYGARLFAKSRGEICHKFFEIDGNVARIRATLGRINTDLNLRYSK